MKDNKNTESNKFREQFPELSSVSKENPFKTPDGYFETLPQTINDRIHKSKKPSLISVILPAQVRVAVATISAVLLIVLGFFWLYDTKTNGDELSDEYIEEYLIGYYQYNSSGFYELMADEEFSAVDAIDADEYSELEQDEEEVLDYIMNNASFYLMSYEDFEDNQ